MNISEIPMLTLLDDLINSAKDCAIAELGLKIGLKGHCKIDIDERVIGNQKIIEKIVGELLKRGKANGTEIST